MFEWGGGAIWCTDQFSYEEFGVGSIEENLPLSSSTLERLKEMQVWHDTALNWADPMGPSPWTDEHFTEFEEAVAAIKIKIEEELGSKFEIEYVPLGSTT